MMRILTLVLIWCSIFVASFKTLAPTNLILKTRRIHMVADGRIPLMGGNWKLNPITTKEAKDLAGGVARLTKQFSGVDVLIFPPHPFLSPACDEIRGSPVKLGAQNCYFEKSGAYTGAVSTEMLKSLDVEYVLCGHSERRLIFGEDDEVINRKVRRILQDGMKVALCIGETKEEYEAGLNEAVCGIQLVSGLADVTVEQMKNVVIAYEPVWAIGTGLVCSKEEAQNIHAYIRSRLAQQFNDDVARQTIIQYGGSVKPDNVKELMAMPDIDGCLVGGASLNAESFAKIVGYKHDGLTIDISSEPALADTVKEMSKRARVKRFLKRLLPGFMKRQ